MPCGCWPQLPALMVGRKSCFSKDDMTFLPRSPEGNAIVVRMNMSQRVPSHERGWYSAVPLGNLDVFVTTILFTGHEIQASPLSSHIIFIYCGARRQKKDFFSSDSCACSKSSDAPTGIKTKGVVYALQPSRRC